MSNTLKQLHVKYYAVFREERGLSAESYQTTAISAKELYDELKSQHKFSLPLNMVRIAINDQFASAESVLKNEDKIVFIPPVAGG